MNQKVKPLINEDFNHIKKKKKKKGNKLEVLYYKMQISTLSTE